VKIPKKYSQPLSLRELATGIYYSEKNAVRLIEDAEILIQNKRFLSAINCLRLAVEELMKSHILYQGTVYGDKPSSQWEWLWQAFTNHREKVRTQEYEIHWPGYEDKEGAVEEFNRRVHRLLEQRENCLYVQFNADRKQFVEPDALFPDTEAFAVNELGYVHNLCKMVLNPWPTSIDDIEMALNFSKADHGIRDQISLATSSPMPTPPES